jgi:hypothetical protein
MESKPTTTLKIENGVKTFRSQDYNYDFDLTTGFFQRWGKTTEDDPTQSPAPEILDIETSINGCPKGTKSNSICQFCYKGNSAGKPSYMTFDTFKSIIDKFPKFNGIHFLTQLAAGITSFNANPDIFKIFEYARSLNIIPNLTISGRDILTDNQITKLVSIVGATAFSIYKEDKDQCYNLINRFIKAGLKQVNVHYMISLESLPFLYEILQDIKNDSRLIGLNAIVFLGLKPKGRGNTYHVLPYEEYDKLIKYCLDNDISFGFDSCSSAKTEKSVSESKVLNNTVKEKILQCCERCESNLMSYYINVDGISFPCSFAEDIEVGTDITKINDFISEAWESPKSLEWRNRLLSLNRQCPLYSEIRI